MLLQPLSFLSSSSSKQEEVKQEAHPQSTDYIPRLGSFLNYARSFPSRLSVNVNIPALFSSKLDDEDGFVLPSIKYKDFLEKLKQTQLAELATEIDQLG